MISEGNNQGHFNSRKETHRSERLSKHRSLARRQCREPCLKDQDQRCNQKLKSGEQLAAGHPFFASSRDRSVRSQSTYHVSECTTLFQYQSETEVVSSRQEQCKPPAAFRKHLKSAEICRPKPLIGPWNWRISRRRSPATPESKNRKTEKPKKRS